MTRESEIERYVRVYEDPKYGMGRRRRADVQRILRGLCPGSLLDVGTGRGETLRFARGRGFKPARGTEVVPALIRGDVIHAQAHELPFGAGSFDHVTCFEVLEHLIEEDIETCLSEMWRVARKTVTVSASSRKSEWPGVGDLHISARPVEEWEQLIEQCWEQPIRIGHAWPSAAWQAQKPGS